MGSHLAGEHSGPSADLPEDDGLLFHRPTTDAMCRTPGSFRAVTGLGYDAVPPSALNELPDHGIEALIDLIMSSNTNASGPTYAIASSS